MSSTTPARSRTRRRLAIAVVGLVTVQLAALVVHHALPQAGLRPDTLPRAGDRFASRTEGFAEEVVDVDTAGHVSVRVVLAPGAAGPPRHHHKTFAERFTVTEGTLTLELGDRVVTLAAGESVEIAPGLGHRPFNPGPTPVVVVSSMPTSFAACLVQIYKIIDGHPDAEGRVMPLQLAVNDDACDTHVDAMPPLVEGGLKLVLAPWARLAGYRAWYPALALHPPHG